RNGFMDLKRLRTFVAVAEEQGFARAAARLHLAQPAVSKHVRDLEADIGGPLFERRSEGIRLTHAGEQLLGGARCLLMATDGLRERVRRAARGESGMLTIGYNETVSWGGVIPKTVCTFRGAYPNVALTMLPMNSVDQIAALRDKRIDAGFLFNRDAADGNLTGIPVLDDPVMLAVPAASPWATEPPRRLAELSDQPFIWVPRSVSPTYHDQIVRHCRDAGLTFRIVQEAMNESAALSLVAVGMGLTFVPASARRRCPEEVTIVPVPDLTLRVTLELAWRAGSDVPGLRNFIDVAERIAGSYPARGERVPEPAGEIVG
ncbi:MAG TPA: LysR family transcriptional regulator, partial [Alphaproteobacteria bacterium]|nr:LysR family transcriptional regulator [Alphaproteobacteria bacterium]